MSMPRWVRAVVATKEGATQYLVGSYKMMADWCTYRQDVAAKRLQEISDLRCNKKVKIFLNRKKKLKKILELLIPPCFSKPNAI